MWRDHETEDPYHKLREARINRKKCLIDSEEFNIFLMMIGFICSITFPFCFFTPYDPPAYILAFFMGFLFCKCSWYGMINREVSPLLRHQSFSTLVQFGITSTVMTLSYLASARPLTTDLGLAGFCMLSGGYFCLVMIAQPASDFGLMHTFAGLPILVFINRDNYKFHLAYIPLGLVTGLFVCCQYYYVKIVNERYKSRLESVKREGNTSAVEQTNTQPPPVGT